MEGTPDPIVRALAIRRGSDRGGGAPRAIRAATPRAAPSPASTQAEALPGVTVFHAGTRRAEDGRLLTDGGRVLAVTGIGADLRQALGLRLCGDGAHSLRWACTTADIGAKALN